jgi:hypothetical protein
MSEFIEAIQSLRPGAHYTVVGDDVENIFWHEPDVQPLSTKEVENEIKRLKEQKIKDEKLVETKYKEKQEAKQNILKKLGLTQDELETLLGA